MNDKTPKEKKKRPGRPPRHGAYSLMVKAGELPKRRTYLRAYLSEVRASLISDLGPKEADLTMAERILINSVVSKLSIIRCIEEAVKEEGVFRGRELSAVLSKSYITYCESLRRDLQALGINTRKGSEIVDLGQYIAAKDSETLEDKASESGKGQEAGGEIARPRSTSCDIPGKDDAGDISGGKS
jgi:vacuolar-type H+-ATPase subunit E/Vma4